MRLSALGVWVDVFCLRTIGVNSLCFASVSIRYGAARIGGGIIRRDLDRLFVVGDCPFEIAFAVVGIAAVVVGVGIPPLVCDVVADSAVGMALVVVGGAPVVIGVGNLITLQPAAVNEVGAAA